MPPINSLTSSIIAAFTPRYAFVAGADFKWSPNVATIYYPSLASAEDVWSLLHEISHGELGHTTYDSDVQLVNHEALAWKHATDVLAPSFGVTMNENFIEDHLDTYRIWLHERSTCPNCGQNGIQTKNTYSCINCRCLWRANEARICGLRRVRLQGQDQIS